MSNLILNIWNPSLDFGGSETSVTLKEIYILIPSRAPALWRILKICSMTLIPHRSEEGDTPLYAILKDCTWYITAKCPKVECCNFLYCFLAVLLLLVHCQCEK